MQPETSLAVRSPQRLSLAPRDLVAVLFRRRKLVIYSAGVTLLGVIVALLIVPATYRSEMKILVKRERVDPMMSPDPSGQVALRTMTPEEVNSEVDLLQSDELLREVVVKAGLDQDLGLLDSFLEKRRNAQERSQARKERIDANLLLINKHLDVTPPNKSNLIRVTYEAKDPEKTAKVLNTLGELYLQKHVSVNSSPGSFEFFQQETELYAKELQEAEKKLTEFSEREGIVSAQSEKDSILQQIAAFDANEQQTVAAILTAQRRIADLQSQLAITPERITTAVHTPSAQVDQLKQTLFTLESRRTELLQKFAPGYRLVKDVDEQIAHTQAAIAAAEKSPLNEPTTDVNPVHEWLVSEIAKTRAELVGLRARSAATTRTIEDYRTKALALSDKGVEQQQLQRNAKLAEENYQLYLKKREQARITGELDKNRIANVTIAEAAAVPALPTVSMAIKLALGLMLSLVVGLGLGFTTDYLDTSIRTPRELEMHLQLPVLAAIPGDDSSSSEKRVISDQAEPAA